LDLLLGPVGRRRMILDGRIAGQPSCLHVDHLKLKNSSNVDVSGTGRDDS
jgi:hypothetical protein